MKIRHALFPVLLCFTALKTSGQLSVTPNQTAAILSSMLASPGITISNPTLTCAALANGTFTVAPGTLLGATTPFPIPNGIILSTGRAANTSGTETFLASTNNGAAGDASLTSLAGATTFDACTLQFDVVPKGDTIKFDYIFGSEEYINSTCGPYNDAFAFFISGPGIVGSQNMALVPGTNIPVTVNSVNSGVPGGAYTLANCTIMGPGSPFTTYYTSNVTGTSFTYRGYTTRLTAKHDVIPCNTYHLKLTIADAGNSLYDSGVFIEAGSLTTPNITGILTACAGSNTTLANNIAGGTWSSSNTSVATVGGSSGVMTGIAAGTSTITYTMGAGCFVTANVTILPLPTAITGSTAVCVGNNITLSSSTAGGSWGSSPTSVATIGLANGILSGVSAGTATITYTSVAGCSATTIVTVNGTTPITGTTTVCQYFTTTLGNAVSGGTWTSANPGVAIINSSGVVTGVSGGTTIISYVLPSSCPVIITITVDPKPSAPAVITPVSLCQFSPATSFIPTGSGITWYGPYYSPGSPSVIPGTDTPGTYHYYATKTSTFGCKSDSAHVTAIVNPKPAPPAVTDIKYCQLDVATSLSATGTNLKWYVSATSTSPLTATPIPTTIYSGTNTWFATQTVNGCESDKAPLLVTVAPKPDFSISGGTKICVLDSMTFSFSGPSANLSYVWSIPGSATLLGGSIVGTAITVRFNDAASDQPIILSVVDSTGLCKTTKSLFVDVTDIPAVASLSQHDVCKGDTVSLALLYRSPNALDYTWKIDGIPMQSSSSLNIVTANSNSGGPFLVSWNTLGNHVIQVQAFGPGNCPSMISKDSLFVHAVPDASFKVSPLKSTPCIEDSIYFEATMNNPTYTYQWQPEHYFSGISGPKMWGRLGEAQSVVTLSVKDPFGCESKSMTEIEVDACCQVTLPSAFTPNNDGHNDYFRPLFIKMGGKAQTDISYHKFHTFRITNRWGQILFESSNSEGKWDGTFNNVPQDMGVYFYYIEYDCDGKNMQQKGDVTLVR